MKNLFTLGNTRLFGTKQIVVYTLGFLAVTIIVQRVYRFLSTTLVEFDSPYYFPMSIFNPRMPSLLNLAVACGTVALFAIGLFLLSKRNFKIKEVVFLGILLVLGTALTQGWMEGFYAPIAGNFQDGSVSTFSMEGQEYYHDAIRIKDPYEFLSNYNAIQTTLHKHAHTHPAGATLLFYFLEKLLVNPALIAVFIAILSVVLSTVGIYLLLRSEVTEGSARYVAYLFTLLPVVHVYYLATLDAIITSLLILVVYFFRHKNTFVGVGITCLLLIASFSLTFVSLFILPVLVGYEVIQKRDIRRSIFSIGGMLGFFVLLYFLTGYNQLEAFRTASAHENRFGFMAFANPVNYFFTRIEDVAEIIFFFGPFLSVLFIRSLKSAKSLLRHDFIVLMLLGTGTLFAMFLSGAFRTGETARACAIIFAFLLLPIALYFDSLNPGSREKWQLAILVFGQAIAMQIFGDYVW